MSFRILCPVCQAAFAIADRYRGKVIRCRKCQCALRVPGKVADDDEKDSEGDLPRTAWPKKRPRKKVALKSASATETKTATHDSRRVLFGNRLPYILGAFALVATIAVVWWPPEVQQSRQQKKLGENEFELDSLPLAVAATHKTLQPLLKRNNFTQMSIVVDNNDERAIVISLFERFKAGKFKAPSLKNLKSMYTHDTPQVHIMRVEDNQAIPKVRHLKLNEEPDSNTFYLVSNVSGKFGYSQWQTVNSSPTDEQTGAFQIELAGPSVYGQRVSSGSPVVSETGRIVGILTYGKNRFHHWVMPIQNLQESYDKPFALHEFAARQASENSVEVSMSVEDPSRTIQQPIVLITIVEGAQPVPLPLKNGQFAPIAAPKDARGFAFGSDKTISLESRGREKRVTVRVAKGQVAKGQVPFPGGSALHVQPGVRTTDGLVKWLQPVRLEVGPMREVVEKPAPNLRKGGQPIPIASDVTAPSIVAAPLEITLKNLLPTLSRRIPVAITSDIIHSLLSKDRRSLFVMTKKGIVYRINMLNWQVEAAVCAFGSQSPQGRLGRTGFAGTKSGLAVSLENLNQVRIFEPNSLHHVSSIALPNPREIAAGWDSDLLISHCALSVQSHYGKLVIARTGSNGDELSRMTVTDIEARGLSNLTLTADGQALFYLNQRRLYRMPFRFGGFQQAESVKDLVHFYSVSDDGRFVAHRDYKTPQVVETSMPQLPIVDLPGADSIVFDSVDAGWMYGLKRNDIIRIDNEGIQRDTATLPYARNRHQRKLYSTGIKGEAVVVGVRELFHYRSPSFSAETGQADRTKN